MKIQSTVRGSALARALALAVLVLVPFIMVAVTGCSRPKSPIVGEWKADMGAVLEFSANGRFKAGPGKYPATGTYAVSGNIIQIQLDGDATKALGAAEWRMALTNDVLYITQPNQREIAFRRIK